MYNISNKILRRLALLSVMLMALSMPSISSAQSVVSEGLLRALSEKVWTKFTKPPVYPATSIRPLISTTRPTVIHSLRFTPQSAVKQFSRSITPSAIIHPLSIPSQAWPTQPGFIQLYEIVPLPKPTPDSTRQSIGFITLPRTVEDLYYSTYRNRFGQSGASSSDGTAFNWQNQYGFSAGNDRARALQNALLGKELTECLSLMITRVDSALIRNNYSCEQLDVLNRLSCGINDVLKGGQNELLTNVQGITRLLDESVALLRENESDDFVRFLENQSRFIDGRLFRLNSFGLRNNPDLRLESGINDGIQTIEREDRDSEEP